MGGGEARDNARRPCARRLANDPRRAYIRQLQTAATPILLHGVQLISPRWGNIAALTEG
jgi:hypothetical protein